MKTLRQRAFSLEAFAGVAAIVVFCFVFIGCGGDNGDATVAVTGVGLGKNAIDMDVNGTAILSATVAPANATNKKVTWSSSDEDTATVSATGVVTAHADGTATITVTTVDGNKTATCTVTVTAVTAVTLNKSVLALSVDGSEKLTPTVHPTNANRNVTWESSDPAKASVAADGTVSGVAAGTATITVTTVGKKADGTSATTSCAVTVTSVDPNAVARVTLDKSEQNMAIGGTETLTATVLPETAADKTVTWESTDEEVATVTPGVSGVATVRALSAGKTTITVITKNGKTDTCLITVSGGDPNVNEVQGKTLYIGEDYKTAFKADLSFETSSSTGQSWAPSYKGSYIYNSTNKTVTLTVSHICAGEDDKGALIWKDKDQAPNDIRFASRIYKYEITPDSSLLGQQIITNNGINELRGETYSLPALVGLDATTYTFDATGNTYSFTIIRAGETVTITGTYYYDSTERMVWLRPTSIGGKNMVQYYNDYDVSGYWGGMYTTAADKKASQTNVAFASQELAYDPDTKKLQRKFGI
jgi:uncharacterized protein YjdB